MLTAEQVLGGVLKGDFHKLVKAFAEKRGLKPKNPAQWKWLFKTHGVAAKELLELAGDYETAHRAMIEIANYLDKQTENEGWHQWTNLKAIVNRYMDWQVEDEAETK